MQTTLRKVMTFLKYTVDDVSNILNIPAPTIVSWYEGKRAPSPWVFDSIIDCLYIAHYEKNESDTAGVLNYSFIKSVILEVIPFFNVASISLFGSYAKGRATRNSDVNLYVETTNDGPTYFALEVAIAAKLGRVVRVLTNKMIIAHSEFKAEIKATCLRLFTKNEKET